MKTLICIVLTLTVVSALTITPAKKFSESWVMEDRGIFYGFDITKLRLGLKSELLDEIKRDNLHHVPEDHEELPLEVDWRKKGVVTPVKNQGKCGSCWSFSATGTLESALAIKTGKLVSLSEQQILDCTENAHYRMDGCGGGMPYVALQYIADVGGDDTEASYPYQAKDGSCHFMKDKVGGTDSGYVTVPISEKALQHAVATTGPVSVAIFVDTYFMLYSSGVFFHADCNYTPNHAVLVVGYGTDKKTGMDYWIVKNSWGDNWGEEGYIRMARNRDNMCNIASFAVYPKLTKAAIRKHLNQEPIINVVH